MCMSILHCCTEWRVQSVVIRYLMWVLDIYIYIYNTTYGSLTPIMYVYMLMCMSICMYLFVFLFLLHATLNHVILHAMMYHYIVYAVYVFAYSALSSVADLLYLMVWTLVLHIVIFYSFSESIELVKYITPFKYLFTNSQSIHNCANVVLHYSKFVTAVLEITELAIAHMCIQYTSYIIKYLKKTAYHKNFFKQILWISFGRLVLWIKSFSYTELNVFNGVCLCLFSHD